MYIRKVSEGWESATTAHQRIDICGLSFLKDVKDLHSGVKVKQW